jgi:hypothetical protein
MLLSRHEADIEAVNCLDVSPANYFVIPAKAGISLQADST